MKTAKRKHRYMTADTHACVLGLILATITLFALCRYLGIEDITGVLLFPSFIQSCVVHMIGFS